MMVLFVGISAQEIAVNVHQCISNAQRVVVFSIPLCVMEYHTADMALMSSVIDTTLPLMAALWPISTIVKCLHALVTRQ